MNDESASYRDRMTAATLIIEHGHGKAVDRQVVATLTERHNDSTGAGLSMDELHRIASGAVVVRDSDQEG